MYREKNNFIQEESLVHQIIEENKTFTSVFIHELRNPLSLLKGTLQYIEAQQPQVREYKYWPQLDELILDLEQIMSNACLLNSCQTIDKQPTDLLALITETKNQFMPQAAQYKVDLTLNIAKNTLPYLNSYNCDQTGIKQIFNNLLKNGLEATSPGNYIHIDVTTRQNRNHEPKYILIDISNNGKKIPKDDIDHIFTPFITFKKEGTGVGLAIVKKIVDLHCGIIEVDSSKTSTHFSIFLPILNTK